MIRIQKTVNGLIVSYPPSYPGDSRQGDDAGGIRYRWPMRCFNSPGSAMTFVKGLSEIALPSQAAFSDHRAHSGGAILAAMSTLTKADRNEFLGVAQNLVERLESSALSLPCEEGWDIYLVEGGGWAIVHEGSEPSSGYSEEEGDDRNDRRHVSTYAFEDRDSMLTWLGSRVIDLVFEE